jgi:hypothetical protein
VPQPPDRWLLDVMEGSTDPSDADLAVALEQVAAAGFHPSALERARGRLAGVRWRGRPLRGSDLLPPAEVHYLWHVVVQRQWPAGTDLAAYFPSIQAIITDPTSGAFLSRYQGVPSLGIVRESREWRGPDGRAWALMQYRPLKRYRALPSTLRASLPLIDRLNLRRPEFPHAA